MTNDWDSLRLNEYPQFLSKFSCQKSPSMLISWMINVHNVYNVDAINDVDINNDVSKYQWLSGGNGWDGDLKTFYVSQLQSCFNVHLKFMILMISMLNRMNKMVGNVLEGLLTLEDFPGKPPHQKGPSMLKIFSTPPENKDK